MFWLTGKILPVVRSRRHDFIVKCISSRFYTTNANIVSPTANVETDVDKWIESLDYIKQKNVRFIQNEVKIILS